MHGAGEFNDFLESFLLQKWRELYIQPSFDDERRFAKIIAGWVRRVGMP